jgi:hypothetical protein
VHYVLRAGAAQKDFSRKFWEPPSEQTPQKIDDGGLGLLFSYDTPV